jgi:Mg-chelatase subunit ChlD
MFRSFNSSKGKASRSTATESSSRTFSTVENNETLAFTVTAKNSSIGLGANVHFTQVCATMKACKFDDEKQRAPVDIVVALDISGSMHGNKLELCKKTLELLIRHLLPQDRFGLVAYESDASTEVPLQFMTPDNKTSTLQRVKSLHTKGCTNISAAIALAFQELRAVKEPNTVRSVFLLTDGHANEGISDHTQLVEFTKGCASFEATSVDTHPLSMFCFGYGSDHNSGLLRDISETTASGSYYFVENDINVGTAFGNAMGGLLSVVAQSTVLTVRVHGAKVKEIYHERVLERDDGSFTVDVGDFYAEESRDVLVEIELLETNHTSPIVEMSLAYADIIAKKPATFGPFVCTIHRPPGNDVSEDDVCVATQWLRICSSRAMKSAREKASQNELAPAREILQAAIEQIENAPTSVQMNEMVQAFKKDLIIGKDGVQSTRHFQEQGGHYLAFKDQCYRFQRSSEAAPDGRVAMFGTATRTQMGAKFSLSDK